MSRELEIFAGDCRDAMALLIADGSVQTCITSPPYFNLRNYDHPDQIGQEPTPEGFVAAMVEVAQGVRGVLADDGTFWLNLGDTYDAKKNRLMIPARVALALQADGWLLRDEIVWHKPAVMPIPIRDRTVPCHEMLYMFSKGPRYLYDHAAIREPSVDPVGSAARYKTAFGGERQEAYADGSLGAKRPGMNGKRDFDGLRNKRSVWSVVPSRGSVGHIAAFPPALIEPCVLACSRPGDLVFDPFGGSGTTAGVALKHGRRALLCELNADNVALMPGRIAAVRGVA